VDDMAKKRIFIAVDLPAAVKERIWLKYSDITDANLKLVKKENIHITLKFIGYADTLKVGKIKIAAQKAANKIDAFKFKISKQLSCFPKYDKAKVLYVGIERGAEALELLFKEVEAELEKLFIRKEKRPYLPHITLARAKLPCNVSEYSKKISFDIENEIGCIKLSLFESILNKAGPVYKIIEEYDLKKKK
jgi:RNA 2',3'-cyclic 3'-phosphodiesterase